MGYRIMEEILQETPKETLQTSQTQENSENVVATTKDHTDEANMSPDQDDSIGPNAATLDVTPVEINVGDKLWRDAHQRQSIQEDEIKLRDSDLIIRKRSETWTSGVTDNATDKIAPMFHSTLTLNELKIDDNFTANTCNGDLDMESLDLSNNFDEQMQVNGKDATISSRLEIDNADQDNTIKKRGSNASVLSVSSVTEDTINGSPFRDIIDSSEFTDINLQPSDSVTNMNTAETPPTALTNVKHSNKPSLGSIFGWIAAKASPTKVSNSATSSPVANHSESQESNHVQMSPQFDFPSKSTLPEVAPPSQAETKKKVVPIKTRSRFWKSSNVEPLSTTALILENRPRNLPEKPLTEAERHKAEYVKMVEHAKKSEVKDMQKKKKQLKLQHKQEDVIASASAVWCTEILPNWTAMHQTHRTRQLWWQGLPPNVRGKVWQLAIGNELNITQDLYEIMVTRAHDKLRSMHETQSIGDETESLSSDRESTVELIRLDISRTFPMLCIFQKGGPYHDILHDILGAYVCYRPDVGYVQGMSFMAAMLLLNMEPAVAFATFANLLNKPCQLTFFRLNEEMMKVYFAAFEVFFEENLPRLFAHFKQNNLTPDMYLIDWIFTMFSKALCFDAACRVWDIFCRDGEEFLFKTAIAILKLHRDSLLSMEFIHAAQFLTRLPTSGFTHHELFRHISEVTMVSRGSRRWKDVLALLRRDDAT
uniref:TBC1 domain family member 14 n=1 Tax=Phallusia mammillata TaxID=59560 RepID=A0A6F9DV23_9ASCI|nr:TBC1 domain family member 14 [Phallusia mammillata]